MKKIFLIAGLLFAGSLTLKAQQDAQYSQYMFNGIYINPAYAGYKEQLNAHSFYRSQWTGIRGAPRTFSVAVDAAVANDNVGLAFQVTSDKLGAQSTLGGYGSYAYRIRLNADGSSRLAFGVSFGILQRSINASELVTNDPETTMPAGVQRTVSPDARAGVYFSNDRFYAGFSVDNMIINYLKSGKYKLVPQSKMHYYLTAGVLLPLNEDFQLKPSFLLKDDLGGPTSLDWNTFILYKDIIWLGGSYRTRVNLYNKDYLQSALAYSNSVVAAIELFPVPNMRVGYAYDITTGPLNGYSSGTHEVSVGYTFPGFKVRMANPRVF